MTPVRRTVQDNLMLHRWQGAIWSQPYVAVSNATYVRAYERITVILDRRSPRP